MKTNTLKKTLLLILGILCGFYTSAQVSGFDATTWSFEQTSGITYASNASSPPTAPGPSDIVTALTQLISGNTTNVFTQSSDVSHTGSYSALADFNVLTGTPKFQTWRPSGANDFVGNFTTGSSGTHRVSVWVYMDNLQAGTLRFRASSGSITNTNFDFDLGEVTTVNTWTKLSAEATIDAAASNIYADITFVSSSALISSSTKVYIDDFSVEKVTTETWTGATDSDWFTDSNWDTNTVPTQGSSVVINSVGTQPIIDGNKGAVAKNLTVNSGASLTIENGSSLLIDGTATGNITYNVNVTDTNWHLITSPVTGEQYDNTWIADNSIVASTTPGKTDNRAIGMYSNATVSNNWSYFNASSGSATTFGAGVGYSLKRTTAGDFSFVGTYPTVVASPTISQNANNWNLVGNSFPAFLSVTNLINANSSNLSPENQAIYVWDGATYQSVTTGFIHPGQAFFINSNVASGTLELSNGLLSQETGVTFYKRQDTTPKIILNITDGQSYKSTEVIYLEGKTVGLDPRFDIGMFDGEPASLAVYSHLVSGDSDTAFEKQALSDTDISNSIIPIGIQAIKDREITFSSEISNALSGTIITLEDKLLNTFTELNDGNTYKVNLTDNINGTGRFFLHTSQKSLSIDNVDFLNTLTMYQSSKSVLTLKGLTQGETSVSIFDILGKELLNTSFNASATKDIALPNNLKSAIYIVKVNSSLGSISKKIILE